MIDRFTHIAGAQQARAALAIRLAVGSGLLGCPDGLGDRPEIWTHDLGLRAERIRTFPGLTTNAAA